MVFLICLAATAACSSEDDGGVADNGGKGGVGAGTSGGAKPESIVMLGLIPDGAAATPTKQLHWHEFLALWGTRGIKGDVAATDYAPFFDSAIAIIDDTCKNFIPPPA